MKKNKGLLPDLSPSGLSKEINRPELDFFQQQKAVVLAQAELIDIELQPKLYIFAQAGTAYRADMARLNQQIGRQESIVELQKQPSLAQRAIINDQI